MTSTFSWFGLAAIVVASFVIIGIGLNSTPVQPPTASPTPFATVFPSPVAVSDDLQSFASWDDVQSFLHDSQAGRGYENDGVRTFSIEESMPLMAQEKSTGTSSDAVSPPSYSTTNVQVLGVDEADRFKTDGKNIYTLSGQAITILRAYPANDLAILSVLNDSEYTEFYLYNNRLVAFGQSDFDWMPIVTPLEKEFESIQASKNPIDSGKGQASSNGQYSSSRYPYYRQSSFMKIFDVSDATSPKLLKTVDMGGQYVSSRMIGEKVYAVFSESASQSLPRPIYAVDGVVAKLAPSDIRYIDYPFDAYQFTTVLSLDVENMDSMSRQIVLMGRSSTVYASTENVYIAYTQYAQRVPIWEPYASIESNFPQDLRDKLAAIDASDVSLWRKDNLKIQLVKNFLQTLDPTQQNAFYSTISDATQESGTQRQTDEQTMVHKFSLGDSILYVGKGHVPGHLLNQFSLDENKGYLRLATTTNGVWGNRIFRGGVNQPAEPSKNHVYVLNASLEQVGALEDLAPGESIYSARFMGNKAYLVTFKQLDPLFVIGFDNPEKPVLLGKLKIPGYSNYLHPYDETHLIGFGKDAIALKDSDLAFPLGLKLSLFDVSDVSHPIEVATLGIGDAGSDSYALNDHKAFVFDKEKGLLVIPVRLAEIPEEKKKQDMVHVYGEVNFQGAYVIDASLEGFKVRGRISHMPTEQLAKMGSYYYGDGTDVVRSAYIGDTLYTASEKFVKANNLQNLTLQGEIKLPYRTVNRGPYYIDDMMAVR